MALLGLALAAAAPTPLTCGAVIRPGIAELGEDGVWRGTAVDVCRSVAASRSGPGAPVAFHSYNSLSDLRAAAKDRLAFLSGQELAQAGMAGGPVAAVDRQVLVVRDTSTLATPSDLSGRIVCFIIGTRAESALNRWSAGAQVPIDRLAFQEPIEMQDAFDSGKCAAVATDSAERPHGRPSRVLGTIEQQPILAATSDGTDAAWRQVIAAGVLAEQPEPEDGERIPGAR
jgi:hypothetical protein